MEPGSGCCGLHRDFGGWLRLNNCVPGFIASNPAGRKRFKAAGLPLIGDDIKSQVSATIIHRMLSNLFMERGSKVKS